MSHYVKLVLLPQVDEVWEEVSVGMEDACQKSGGDFTSDYLWRQCRSGEAFLMIVVDGNNDIVAAMVLRFELWSSGKKLRVLAMYGSNMEAWLDRAYAAVVKLAHTGNATSLVADARPGFERVLKKAKVLRKVYEELI